MRYGTTIKVPFGPQHPALKEPEYFLFEVEGDFVVNVKPRIGYVHRGLEKAFENNTYMHGLYLAERICGICSHAHTVAFTQAVEGLVSLEIPQRAQYIRLIMAELERLHSHSLWVGIVAHEAGFDTMFMYLWRDREMIMDLMEEISGNRVLHAINTIGGVRRDINDEQANKIRKYLDKFEENIKNYIKILETENTFLKRTVGVGILKPSDAIALCAVGPTLRASGIKNDVRKDDPYLVYDEIPFEVITHDGCDVFARTIVRCEEMLESIKIIRYALDHMPKGELKVKAPRTFPPNESIGRVEAPRGELIHYTKSNGTSKPERYKVRSPTLGNLASVCKTLIGAHIADIPIILAGIDPCFSCMDRILIKKRS
ncbi:MAG: nickel-dependent hydrogenase large subunit [Candidatus Verstraetearchaeota archaeon]|nr:nickel-dependent hydrogenase large subunit [Candidatus Verstraetearchaeota archaeon]